MTLSAINFQCRHYRGSRPCKFNKLDGAECPTCSHASNYRCRVLIIKLDALGDVLRTGSLVPAITARHDAPYIAWLTRANAVDLVAMLQGVDEVIPFTVDAIARIATGAWDYVYSLSNDYTSASLATLSAPMREAVGFTLRDGVIWPSNPAAELWLQMASFDRLKRANTATYQKRMLDIIGVDEPFDPPKLNIDERWLTEARRRVSELLPGRDRRRVAINVGAGGRWPKKMLSAMQIAAYARAARSRLDVDILLVGGESEAAKAEEIMKLTGGDSRVASVLTATSLPEFVAVLKQANMLLCGDTLALHVATAIGLPSVCLVGPTSLAELAEFGRLVLRATTAGLDCLGCYGDCNKTDNCMSLFTTERLIYLTARQLSIHTE